VRVIKDSYVSRDVKR